MLAIFIPWSAARWLFSIVIGRNFSVNLCKLLSNLLWVNSFSYDQIVCSLGEPFHTKQPDYFILRMIISLLFEPFRNSSLDHFAFCLCYLKWIYLLVVEYFTDRTSLYKCENHSVIVGSDKNHSRWKEWCYIHYLENMLWRVDQKMKLEENPLSRWNGEIPPNTYAGK